MWLTTDELNVFLLNSPTTGGASNTTSESCTHVNMGRYQSAIFLVPIGTNSVTTTNFFIMEASTATAAGQATSKYNYRYASTAGTATLSARTAGASTALALTSTAETMYVFEVKSDDLSAGYNFVYPSLSSAAATRNAAVVAVLKPRYPQNSMMAPNT